MGDFPKYSKCYVSNVQKADKRKYKKLTFATVFNLKYIPHRDRLY